MTIEQHATDQEFICFSSANIDADRRSFDRSKCQRRCTPTRRSSNSICLGLGDLFTGSSHFGGGVSTLMTESIRFEVAGLTFHGLCFGPADGIPVLALHGWLDNAASFTRLGPLLTGCRVIAVDQRGHGMTDHLGRPYHIWDGVPDVIGILDALGWEQAILLGHSMGAAVATLVASAYPDRIQALWLVEGLGPWTYPGWRGA